MTIGSSIRWFSARLRTAARKTMFGPEMLEGLARIGYATRGLVYLFLGVLAVASALSETRPPDLAGVFSIVDHLPGGWLLLLTIALGLCAYGGWRLMQALLDLRGCGSDLKGLLRRTALLGETVFYAGLGLLAAVISIRESKEISAEIKEEAAFVVVWTEMILGWPLGHWIIGLVGLGAIGMGGGQLLRARSMAFEDIRASERAMIAIRLVGRIGFVAKGIIFAATGIPFLIAAWRTEASAAGGMHAALAALASVPLGDRLLLAVSVGLMLYGIFSLVKAWCHKPVTP